MSGLGQYHGGNGTRLRVVALDELRELSLQVVQGPSYRLALSVEEAAASVGLSRDLLDALIRDGDLRVVRAGRRVLVPVRELERWLDRAARVWTEADQ